MGILRFLVVPWPRSLEARHEDHEAETRKEASELLPQQLRSPRAVPDPPGRYLLSGGAAGSHPAAGAAAPLPDGGDAAVHYQVGLRAGRRLRGSAGLVEARQLLPRPLSEPTSCKAPRPRGGDSSVVVRRKSGEYLQSNRKYDAL